MPALPRLLGRGFVVQPQVGLSMGLIGSVAMKAMLREDRSNLQTKVDCLNSSLQGLLGNDPWDAKVHAHHHSYYYFQSMHQGHTCTSHLPNSKPQVSIDCIKTETDIDMLVVHGYLPDGFFTITFA
jgi:hypothetical protein